MRATKLIIGFWMFLFWMLLTTVPFASGYPVNSPAPAPKCPNPPASLSRMNEISHDHPDNSPSENPNDMSSSTSFSRLSTSKFQLGASNDDFITLQSRISSLARIVSGVALLNGLSTDSIPTENVISELLNVASFKIEDLENFDKTKVDTFAGTLKEATEKLSEDTEVLEKSITDLNEIKEMWSDVVDLDKLPKKAKFQKIKDVASLDLKAINDFSPDDASKLRTLEDSVKGLNEKLTPIREMIDSMKPFHEFVKVMQFFDSSSINEIAHTRPEFVTQMETTVSQLESIPLPELSIISSMASVISSRFGVSVVDRKFTPGFINGFRDLKNLRDDVKDPWVSEIVGVHTLESLTNLENLEKKMTELDSKWSTVNAKDTLTKATSIGNLFGSFSGSSKVSEIVEHLGKAPAVASSKTLTDDALKMDKNLCALTEKMTSLLEIEKIISDGQTDSISISSKLAPHLEIVKSEPKLADISSDMMKDEMVITEFTKKFRNYLDLFNYVKDMNLDLESIASASKLSLNLRGLDSGFYNNLEAASSSIQESTTLITEIKAELDQIKKLDVASRCCIRSTSQQSEKHIQRFKRVGIPEGSSRRDIVRIKFLIGVAVCVIIISILIGISVTIIYCIYGQNINDVVVVEEEKSCGEWIKENLCSCLSDWMFHAINVTTFATIICASFEKKSENEEFRETLVETMKNTGYPTFLSIAILGIFEIGNNIIESLSIRERLRRHHFYIYPCIVFYVCGYGFVWMTGNPEEHWYIFLIGAGFAYTKGLEITSKYFTNFGNLVQLLSLIINLPVIVLACWYVSNNSNRWIFVFVKHIFPLILLLFVFFAQRKLDRMEKEEKVNKQKKDGTEMRTIIQNEEEETPITANVIESRVLDDGTDITVAPDVITDQ